MVQTQGIQEHQVIQILDNDIYDSAGSNSSSSYVSASGIKSVLFNAWNAVKSAVSGMLSSFGLHLCGQQGSDKPGREIVMDMSSRPAQPLPGMDEQFDNTPYGSNNDENIYSEIDENASSETDDPANHIYEDPDADDPVNHIYEDPDDYRRTGNVIDSENMLLVCKDSGKNTYAKSHDSPKAGGRTEQEGMDPEYASLHENIYSEPYKPGNTVSTPENDRQQSLPDAQLQQRIMRGRLNTL